MNTIEPLPPNDRIGLLDWLRRLALLVTMLAKRLEALEKKVDGMNSTEE